MRTYFNEYTSLGPFSTLDVSSGDWIPYRVVLCSSASQKTHCLRINSKKGRAGILVCAKRFAKCNLAVKISFCDNHLTVSRGYEDGTQG